MTLDITSIKISIFAWVSGFQGFSKLGEVDHVKSQQHPTIALGDSKAMTEMWSLLGRPEVLIKKRQRGAKVNRLYPMGIAGEMDQINMKHDS